VQAKQEFEQFKQAMAVTLWNFPVEHSLTQASPCNLFKIVV